ncbi:hypothetical protein IFR05_007525 [Cadophora sp. M221]|nr:hypothetical protein IFR05_007525 [Cadophora sp. M221]
MAILTEAGNEYEVNVVRRPQNTKFEEYVKVGERESTSDRSRERYIVGEPGQTYAIEVAIKKGFSWGKYDQLEVGLLYPGMDCSVVMKLLHKQELRVDMSQQNTEIHLDCVSVGHSIDNEFFGARFTLRRLTLEFLEHLSIVPYPPPLYCYAWEKLTGAERKAALEEMQGINRGEFRARLGLNPGDGYDRKEWRSWYHMDLIGSSSIFIVIDEDGPAIGRTISSRTPESRQPQRSTSNPRTSNLKNETVDLEAETSQSISKKRDRSASDLRQSSRNVKIKQEPIDVDALEDRESDLRPAPTIKYDSVGPEDQTAKRVKLEEKSEHANMKFFTEFEKGESVLVEDDDLSDDERREGETRSDELERQAEAENELARQELADLLS